MSELEKPIELKCTHCEAVVAGQIGNEHEPGDTVVCPHCGAENDFDDMVSLVEDAQMIPAGNPIEDHLHEQFDEIFKDP